MVAKMELKQPRTGERAERLRSKVQVKSIDLSKFTTTERFHSECMAATKLRKGTRLCLERARMYTESYRRTEGEPMVIRRAKALEHILDNMTIYILEDELIIGNFASRPDALQFHPEEGQDFVDKALDDTMKDMLDDVQKPEARELLAYWRDKSMMAKFGKALPEDLKRYVDWNGVCHAVFFRPLEMMDFKVLLDLGLNGMIGMVEKRLERLQVEIETMDIREWLEAKQNLQAMKIALSAGARFGKRYARLAQELAQKEKNETRRKELLAIAEACDWVPANPPRTLHEAIQSMFFANLISKQILFHGQGWGARMDVLLNPFYQKDKAAGKITRRGAQELLECLFIKLSERGHLASPNVAGGGPGNSDWIDYTVGGVSPEGDDVTNEFSFILLDAAKSAMVPEPTMALRYSPRTPDALLEKAIDVLQTGIGYPAFFNDAAIVPWLMGLGVSLEEARDYGIVSCVNVEVPSRNMRPIYPHAGQFNLLKCLELVLYQGKDKDVFTGEQLGPVTPDPRTFRNIEDFIEAYLTQVGFFVDKLAKMIRIAHALAQQYMQRPFGSAFIRGCIEKGKDATALGDNLYTSVLAMGATNVANSLSAIKKFVFDEKKLTMDEMIGACRTNFEGKEDLRQRLINEGPKFGNDDDYVDRIAREVHIRANEEFMKHKDLYGFPLMLSGSIAGGYYGLSRACGATPDGRRDHDSTADAIVSPMAGTDKKGPTGVLKSVSKITPTYNHLLNQKFLPQFLEGDNNRKKFIQYLRTWGDLGIHHIQFNVVRKEALIEAQKHPEEHSDLIVRVAGYSAYFVDLPKGVQDDIIQRTEQSLM
jgi:pyruvate formate-lyase/glycerol dehydratase family glycyl radical enzyme